MIRRSARGRRPGASSRDAGEPKAQLSVNSARKKMAPSRRSDCSDEIAVSRPVVGSGSGPAVSRSWCTCGEATRIESDTAQRQSRRRNNMPLFLDVHTIEGVTAEAVAQAHQADLDAQRAHGVNYSRYWVNESEGKVFCLVEAPSAEAARAVHLEAHGLVADHIFPVEEGA